MTNHAEPLPAFLDMHLHVGRVFIDDTVGMTPEMLLGYMEMAGIARAVLLSVENPEETTYFVPTEYVLEVSQAYPGRFIPFCNVDPRIASGDNSRVIRHRIAEYVERGCKGFGEELSGLPIDDTRLQGIYAACGEFGLPITLHLDSERNLDEVGLPGLERMLQKFPQTIFIGHAQHFWAEISGDVTLADFSSYPNLPVAPGGALPRLFDSYPNLYADLSAGSGLNALRRDPAFGISFLERYQDRLFFATDACLAAHCAQMPGITTLLRTAVEEGAISTAAYRKIAHENAERVLKLDRVEN